MNGMIDKQMQGAAAPADTQAQGRQIGEELAAGGSAGKLTITPQSVMAEFQLQPGQGEKIERIVTAGRKVMYAEQSRPMIEQALAGEGSDGQKVGAAVAGLMGLLMQESKGALPPELVIPAGLVLVAEAAGFAAEIGLQVDDREAGEAMSVFIDTMFRELGADPDRVLAEAEAAGGVQTAGQPPGGGVVGGAMKQGA